MVTNTTTDDDDFDDDDDDDFDDEDEDVDVDGDDEGVVSELVKDIIFLRMTEILVSLPLLNLISGREGSYFCPPVRAIG